jgi:hypothetical protein
VEVLSPVIFCIGNRARYDAKLALGEPLYKLGRGVRKGRYYDGGSVWQTEADARAFIARKRIEVTHEVYGVVADWETGTIQAAGEPYRRLVDTARIVRLEGSSAQSAP